MYTCNEAKNECKKILEKISEHYSNICKRIINKDICSYLENHSDLRKQDKYHYLLDEKIEIYIGDGLLTLDDRRNTVAFRWVFELEFNGELQMSDAVFVDNHYINTIEHMTFNEYEEYKNEVEALISRLNETLEKLSNDTVETWSYTYICDYSQTNNKVKQMTLENTLNYVKQNPFTRII